MSVFCRLLCCMASVACCSVNIPVSQTHTVRVLMQLLQMLVSHVMYPFNIVSNVMAVNNSGSVDTRLTCAANRPLLIGVVALFTSL